MTDRYVIVCQDGYVSHPLPKVAADRLLASWLKTRHGQTRPAYRIRIREKDAKTQLVEQAQKWGLYDLHPDPRGPDSTYRPDPFYNLPAPGHEAR